MEKIALITGATSGIGEATARLMADHGLRLILTGRRKERLEKLEKELQTKTDVLTRAFDVRDRAIVNQVVNELPESWKSIDILINNAGNAHGLEPMEAADVDDWDAMIDINVKGLLYVSRAIMPGMVERGQGHIVNIGSIAGKEVYPKGGVYCASKHAVDAISKGMLIDLHKYGIRVSEVNPGLVETEFSMVRFKGDAEKAGHVYQGMKPLTGHDVAELIYFIVSRPPHVNITDAIIFPAAQASATIVSRKGE